MIGIFIHTAGRHRLCTEANKRNVYRFWFMCAIWNNQVLPLYVCLFTLIRSKTKPHLEIFHRYFSHAGPKAGLCDEVHFSVV